ncbi:MAG: hypothetical protein ABI977_08340 [Acidobacteriota bacterium]
MQRYKPSYSTAQQQAGFQHFASANAFVTNLRVNAGENSVALLIVAVMYVEAANGDFGRFAKEFFVPGLALPGGPYPHLMVIVQQLNADVYALIANKPGSAFKQSRNFPFAQSAKRTAQNGLPRLPIERPAETLLRID